MNDARFSMRLPQGTLDFAQGYAAQCNMTLTDLVLRYFAHLKETATSKAVATSRGIGKYVGAVPAGLSDKAMDDARFRHLMEKYA